jgi:hypothetical protein
MFNLTDHGDTMQVDSPPVVCSSFRPVSPLSTAHKKPPSNPVQTLTPLADDVEAVCAEIPKKLQLGKAIWHSAEESPEDFWDKDFEVKEAPCYEYEDEEGVIPGPCWSPLSPYFPKRSASAAEKFITPHIVETQPAISEDELITESLLNAWLGTSVLTDPEWTELPSRVCP